jgi:hypothetical protein
MVRQLPSAPAGWKRSVVFYVRIPAEDLSRQLPYQPRPPELIAQLILVDDAVLAAFRARVEAVLA